MKGRPSRASPSGFQASCTLCFDSRYHRPGPRRHAPRLAPGGLLDRMTGVRAKADAVKGRSGPPLSILARLRRPLPASPQLCGRSLMPRAAPLPHAVEGPGQPATTWSAIAAN